ncbi:glycine betaine ABC transporter substrate-binding protein [Nocardioides sp. 1609]|uniref:glycine betaine ABC transporter substrate-binding protein n=1 Tax=Nocardioides sp. 1609 TaxID=2508327 RepID=UPI00106F3782|nr:glycine betaine ABC transporter substrate-binding protein [Nocardioides sp. 1609]
MKTRLRNVLAGAAAAAVVTTTAGCGLGTAGGFVPDAKLAGPLADAPRLDGVPITVGSKNFSENILLGKMALILFKAAGADTEDLTNIPGSAPARQAHVEGDIDAMWEYTGTGWLVYLGHPEPVQGKDEQYAAVRDEDLEVNGLDWLPPAPMNNTYAFAVTKESQEKYGITKLSEIKEKVPKAERTFCVESEFRNRADGLEGMLKAYDVPLGNEVPSGNLQTYQTGAIYDATASGQCLFGEVFTTDGRILALDLQVLEDDKAYFPNYNVSLVVRSGLLKDHPEIEDLMAPVTEKLTDDVMKQLNAEIDVDGREPEDVAFDWLKSEGFVSDP